MDNNASGHNESQLTQPNGVNDPFKSQKYVEVPHASKILNLNAFEPIECIYEVINQHFELNNKRNYYLFKL